MRASVRLLQTEGITQITWLVYIALSHGGFTLMQWGCFSIREVPASVLGPKTGCPACGISFIPLAHLYNYWDSTSNYTHQGKVPQIVQLPGQYIKLHTVPQIVQLRLSRPYKLFTINHSKF
jgi:hypothetical protein